MVVNAKPDLDPKSVLDAEDWYQTREISDAEYRELIAQGRVPPRLDDPEKALEDLAIYGNFLYDSGLEAPGLLTTGIAIATGVGVADHPMRELTDDEKIHFLAAGATNVVAGMAWAVSVVGKPVIRTGNNAKPQGSGESSNSNKGFLPDEYYNGTYNTHPPLIRDSSGNIKLYRSVSEAEYSRLLNGQPFEAIPSSMDTKWFATSIENANTWGKKMDFGGQYRIIEITVPESAIHDMYYGGPNLDGIGPAYNAAPELINPYLNTIKPIQ